MKTVKPMKNRKNITTVLAALVMGALVLIVTSMPTVILDILMVVNLIQALCILFIAVFTGGQRRTRGNKEKTLPKETSVFSFLPMASLFCTLFGLVVFVAFTRLPLTKGTGIDSTILSLVSGLVHIDGSIIGIITSFILLIVICAVMTVIIIKGLTRVIEVAAQFSLDAMPVKIMAAECEYNSGEISEETFIARKDNILRRTDFFGAMEGANKFVTGSAKVMIIIIALELLGGIIIGTRFHGQTIQEATKTVIAFCLSEAIIFLLPLFLLSAAMCTIITRISFPEE